MDATTVVLGTVTTETIVSCRDESAAAEIGVAVTYLRPKD